MSSLSVWGLISWIEVGCVSLFLAALKMIGEIWREEDEKNIL